MSIIGSHVQALPIETLKKEKSFDFVFTNEAVYSLRNILGLESFSPNYLKNVNGIAYRDNNEILMTNPEKELYQMKKWILIYQDMLGIYYLIIKSH